MINSHQNPKGPGGESRAGPLQRSEVVCTGPGLEAHLLMLRGKGKSKVQGSPSNHGDLGLVKASHLPVLLPAIWSKSRLWVTRTL